MKSKQNARRLDISESSLERMDAQRVGKDFEEYYSPTLQSSFSYIEGFLLKGIEKDRLVRLDKFHLRFFKVLFTSGTLVIKEDRKYKEQKTYDLSGLRNVVIIGNFDPTNDPIQSSLYSTNDHLKRLQLPKKDIEKMYTISERNEIPVWKHCFRLEFPNRNYKLYAANRNEMMRWMRVFRLILQMN